MEGTHCQAPGAELGKVPVTASTFFPFPLQPEAVPQGHSRQLLFCRVCFGQQIPNHSGPRPPALQQRYCPRHSLGDIFFIFQRLIFPSPVIQEKPDAASAQPQQALGASSSVTPNGPWKEPRELVPDGDHEGGVARGTPKEAADRKSVV